MLVWHCVFCKCFALHTTDTKPSLIIINRKVRTRRNIFPITFPFEIATHSHSSWKGGLFYHNKETHLFCIVNIVWNALLSSLLLFVSICFWPFPSHSASKLLLLIYKCQAMCLFWCVHHWENNKCLEDLGPFHLKKGEEALFCLRQFHLGCQTAEGDDLESDCLCPKWGQIGLCAHVWFYEQENVSNH